MIEEGVLSRNNKTCQSTSLKLISQFLSAMHFRVYTATILYVHLPRHTENVQIHLYTPHFGPGTLVDNLSISPPPRKRR
jgi:hypothetical protein